MKEKDVISDYKIQKYILYAEKNDGSYGTVEGGSYMIENDLDDFWHKKSHLEKTLRERLLKNEITAIYYFMVLEEMTIAELALRAGIRKGKVKCHLNPEKFKKIKVDELQKYARAFNIPIANFFQIILTSTDQNPKYHFYHEEENQKDSSQISQQETQNPNIIITKVEGKK
jgi:transcriptional regulator with XRE-family HTH domain